MSGGQMEIPARGQAQPGQDGRFAIAAGTCKIAHAHYVLQSRVTRAKGVTL